MEEFFTLDVVSTRNFSPKFIVFSPQRVKKKFTQTCSLLYWCYVALSKVTNSKLVSKFITI